MTHLSPAAAGKPVTLHFDDHALMPLLLGDHDRHLARIEQALGVRLSCRGNRIAIAGEPARVEAAQTALASLYRRLERGEAVGGGEVETAIRLADGDGDPRLPLSDLPAIHTRRGAVGPRSPGQAAYMEALARDADGVRASAPPAPARPISRSRRRSRCCNPAASTGSSSPARRWRRASGSASCPAT